MLNKPFLLLGVFLFVGTAVRAQDEVKIDDKHEKVIVDLLKAMNGISDKFEKITNVETAAKAKPELDKLANQLDKIAKEANKLKKPKPKRDKELKDKYAKKLQGTMTRFITNARRVSQIPEIQPVLKDFGERLRDIGQAMKKVGQ